MTPFINKATRILTVSGAFILYVKIIWTGIWAMKMFYPYDINLSWVIPVIIIDLFVLYFYCRKALKIHMAVSLFMTVSALAVFYIVFDSLLYYYEEGVGYYIPH